MDSQLTAAPERSSRELELKCHHYLQAAGISTKEERQAFIERAFSSSKPPLEALRNELVLRYESCRCYPSLPRHQVAMKPRPFLFFWQKDPESSRVRMLTPAQEKRSPEGFLFPLLVWLLGDRRSRES